jgi:hypothetical protein
MGRYKHKKYSGVQCSVFGTGNNQIADVNVFLCRPDSVRSGSQTIEIQNVTTRLIKRDYWISTRTLNTEHLRSHKKEIYA